MGPRTPRLGALGDAIAHYRKEADLSQEELGARSDLHPTHISGLERGLRNPTFETLCQISAALGMTPGELVTLADKNYARLSRAEKT